jgi:hypothetical protein
MNGGNIALDDMYLIVKCFFYVLILIYASYRDIKENIIPDKVHLIIMIVGFIKINLMDSALGFIIVPLPFL